MVIIQKRCFQMEWGICSTVNETMPNRYGLFDSDFEIPFPQPSDGPQTKGPV
jgi:hypothetical protein